MTWLTRDEDGRNHDTHDTCASCNSSKLARVPNLLASSGLILEHDVLDLPVRPWAFMIRLLAHRWFVFRSLQFR